MFKYLTYIHAVLRLYYALEDHGNQRYIINIVPEASLSAKDGFNQAEVMAALVASLCHAKRDHTVEKTKYVSWGQSVSSHSLLNYCFTERFEHFSILMGFIDVAVCRKLFQQDTLVIQVQRWC